MGRAHTFFGLFVGARACLTFKLSPVIHQAQHPFRVTRLAASTIPGIQDAPAIPAQLDQEGPAVRRDLDDNERVEQFEWFKQWYAVRAAEFLDASRPHAVQLLGRDLVLWNDGTAWRCYEDACPHRMAPLSEGRVESDGSLLCAYHAWRFAGSDGQCVDIPQSPPEVRQKHQSMPSACAKSFPVKVAQGVIFVWPESGPVAKVASAERSPSLVPELDDPDLLAAGRLAPRTIEVRHMVYAWDTLIENILDSAHVPVTHHKMAGSRYVDAIPLSYKSLRPLDTQKGLAFEVSRIKADGTPGPRSVLSWNPPSHLRVRYNFGGGAASIVSIYATPTVPGRCMFVGRQVLIKSEKGELPSVQKGLLSLPSLPAWMRHVAGMAFLHQDMGFLHHQQRVLQSRGVTNANYHREVYSPNGQDTAILTFRRWLVRCGGGGVPWPVGTDTTLPRLPEEQMYNVYEMHTKDCVVCQGALRNFERAASALKVASLATLVAAARCRTLVPLAALGATCYGAALGIDRFKQLFHLYRFRHQDND